MAFKRKVKSGDSQLQDAEAARAKAYKEGGSWEPKETRESLIAEVQDGAEQKRAVGDVAGADRSMAALTKLTQALEMMEKRIASVESRPQNDPTQVIAGRGKIKLLRCPTCKQYLFSASLKRGVCKGEHVMVRVAPHDPEMYQFFQPVEINGVRYFGRTFVPPSIEQELLVRVSRWERRERKKFIKGGRIFGENELSTGSTSQVALHG